MKKKKSAWKSTAGNRQLHASVAVIAFSLFAASCSTSRLNVEKPKENYIEPAIEEKMSTIGMSLDIDMPSLEKSINALLPSLLYEENSLEENNLMLKVWKTQNIRFSINGNKLSCTLPLKIWAQTGFKKTVLGVTAQQYYQANGAITVKLTTSFQLLNDWKLATYTSLDSYTWTEKPTIKVAGFAMPVTTIADIVINSMKNTINSSINKAVAENLDIKSIMEEAWKKAQEPVLIDSEYDAWLKISPENVYSTNISNSGNNINIHLGMDAVIEANVGKKPAVSKRVPLPNYKQVSQIKPNFNIRLNVDVDMKKLKEIAQKEIVGKTFEQGRKKVIINDLDIYGHDDFLVIAVHVLGAVKGSVYCVGKLYFDNEVQSLRITDFDFDMKTKNALAKTANWLLHKKFLSLIEPYLTIPLKKEISEVMQSSNEMLSNYAVMKGVSLKGKINSVTFDRIDITSSSVIIRGNLKGNLNLSINQLEF
ncbi:MAG: DUF4403 family protein [Lentimicrobiaceae bacterium]|nr:DUF4403 family protein [Lentimicrobiaceae bacterium]